MKIKRGRIAPLVTLAVLTLCAASSPASLGAAKATPKCPPNSLCVWSKTNYRGDRLVIDQLGASNKIYRKMNDRVSSASLRHPGYAVLYEDVNGGGDMLCLLDAPGVRKYPDLDAMSYGNIISSSELSNEPIGTCF
jgi:hypothetical protein